MGDMRVLIMGSGCFTGRSTIVGLYKRNYDVWGIQRRQIVEEWLVPSGYADIMKNKIFINDIRDKERIEEIIKEIKPEVVINFIAQGMVNQSWSNPELWYDTNITQLVSIISKIKKEILFIQASTPEVYGGKAIMKHKEATNYDPETPYALSKACFDKHLELITESSEFRVRLTRASNIYGESQELYRLIPRITYACLKNREFFMNNGGKAKRNFLHIDDYVNGIDKIIQMDRRAKDKVRFDIYHLAGEEMYSIKEVVEMVCKIHNIDYDKLVTSGISRQHEDKIYSLSTEKARDELLWKPSICLGKGILLSKEYYKNKLSGVKTNDLEYTVRP